MIKVSNLEFKAIIMSAYDGTLGINKDGEGNIVFHTQQELTGDFTERVNIMCDDKLAVLVFDKGRVVTITVTELNLWRC